MSEGAVDGAVGRHRKASRSTLIAVAVAGLMGPLAAPSSANAAGLSCEAFKAKLDEAAASLTGGETFFRYEDSSLNVLAQNIKGIPDTKIVFDCSEDDVFKGIGGSSWAATTDAAEQWTTFTTALALTFGLAEQPSKAASVVRRMKNKAVAKRQASGEDNSGNFTQTFGRYEVEYEAAFDTVHMGVRVR